MGRPTHGSDLPLASLERILRKAGAHRVSVNAPPALVEILEEYARNIVTEAEELASHAGRKTVRDIDIRLAAVRSGKLP